jgi:predicted AAA+ superfamily ATPase
MVRVIPRADMSEGWDIFITPSSDKMLSKKEKTSLAVEGGMSASRIGGRRRL